MGGCAISRPHTFSSRVADLNSSESPQRVVSASRIFDAREKVLDKPVNPETPSTFEVVIQKKEGVPLGAAMKRTGDDNILMSISEAGALKAWNDEHPDNAVYPGDKIVAVNGVYGSEFYEMVHQLWETGTMKIQIAREVDQHIKLRRTPSRVFLADSNWGREAMLRCPVDTLPHTNAADSGATGCAICFDDFVDPETRVVQFPCNHCFHPACASHWFNQCKTTCPLCVQEVPGVAEFVSRSSVERARELENNLP